MEAGTYISKRVDALRHRSHEFHDISEGVFNDFDTWSALKLILHSAAVNMYTRVHASQGTGDTFYVDALAGSGVSMYESERCFLGSPLVAARATEHPFSKMYFIESDEDYCEALRERLSYAFSLPDFTEPDDWMVKNANANEAIPEIVKEIWRIGDIEEKFNYYCFIDNQGLDVNWCSLEELTPSPYGDLLINLPTAQAIGRNVNKDSTDALNEFYGTDVSQFQTAHNTRERMKQLYLDRLAEQNRSIHESTQVRTPVGSYYYDMIYATRETNGDNGYMEVIQYAKQFIESVHSGDVDRMLEVLDGNQDMIDSYLPDSSIDDDLFESENEEDDSQSGLDDFF